MKKENLFTELVRDYGKNNSVYLGPYASYTWQHDPKHHLFTLARYKFCSKMLVKQNLVLEVGCGDATGIPLLLQSVNSIYAIDINSDIIEYNQVNNTRNNVIFEQRDIMQNPFDNKFDAALSLDVIEHIPSEYEDLFIKNISRSLTQHSVFLIGTPNITANKYASIGSQREHINMKSHETLYNLLNKYFYHVFIFSMNDEVLHTGFYEMGHYILAVCSEKKVN